MAEYLENLTAALADRYAIERELGAGGMATVYLARDLKHDRLVAVKVLDPDLAASIGADRFLREIQVTAKLSHPHILPLYDSGDAGGFLYYVMPFVEGESLADKIAREKQLSIREAVQITREVAEALAVAHSYGLVHRDIKPQNVMMSGGHAIVADFGIATAVSQAGGEKLTKTGMSVGTPAYMSPEQAMAADQMDGRADIYSLGCVLYEMLVGQIPFTGTTPQQIIARHSMDHVPPPHIMRDTIPDALEEIVLRCMAKVPADRYRTAFEMAEALAMVDTATAVHRVSPTMQMLARRRRRRRILVPAGVALGVVALAGAAWAVFGGRRGSDRSAPSGFDSRRIAVLYFEDLSRDSSLGHVADGLTEALIEQLSQVRALDVVSRNGVAPFRGGRVARDSTARALQAGSLIEGSIEPLGDRVRIAVRLVDGNSGTDLQRASVELPVRQLLAVRDSVVRHVAGLLRERLGEEVALRERRAGAASEEAWLLVQRAERLRKDASAAFRRDDVAGAVRTLAQADSLLALAQAVDPTWKEPVLLRGWVARSRASLAPPLEAPMWIDSGLALAGSALRSWPNDPKALELRGTLRYAKWGRRVVTDPSAQRLLLEDAKEDLETATAADPTLAAANLTLSNLLYDVDDVPGAVLRARQAYEEDAYLSNADAALRRLFLGSLDLEQFSEARRWCATGAQRFPGDYRFVACELLLMVTPAVQPNVDRAWALLAELERVTPVSRRAYDKADGLLLLAGALARAGLADSARHVMLQARKMATHEIDPNQSLLAREAFVRTLTGDYDEAIDLLKRAIAANPGHEFTEEAGNVWWWRPLSTHPRWREIAQPGR